MNLPLLPSSSILTRSLAAVLRLARRWSSSAEPEPRTERVTEPAPPPTPSYREPAPPPNRSRRRGVPPSYPPASALLTRPPPPYDYCPELELTALVTIPGSDRLH